MNSYHLAILPATNNGKCPELGDCWRNYHPEAILSDSDYPVLTDENRLPVCVGEFVRLDAWLSTYSRSRSRVTPSRPVGASARVRQAGGRGAKRLYVPVTRKVTDTDDSKASKMHLGMIQK